MQQTIIRRCISSASQTSFKMDPEEYTKFLNLSKKWWSPSGEFQALHAMNRIRVPWIRDGISAYDFKSGSQPLLNKKILDIGCGGGILCEPLARLGAHVTGIDLVEESVNAAEAHLNSAHSSTNLAGRVKYLHCSVQELARDADQLDDNSLFDAVIASEVLEHVNDWEVMLTHAIKLLKPRGSLFLTTINRTTLSYWLAVVAAESLCGIVPPGTHDWQKFITPEELAYNLRNNNMKVNLVHGMIFNPVSVRWSWMSNTDINYAIHAVKMLPDSFSENKTTTQ